MPLFLLILLLLLLLSLVSLFVLLDAHLSQENAVKSIGLQEITFVVLASALLLLRVWAVLASQVRDFDSGLSRWLLLLLFRTTTDTL